MRWTGTLIVGMLIVLGTVASVAAQGPTLEVTAPQPDATIDGTSVKVSFEAPGTTLVPSAIPLAEAGMHPEVNRTGEGHIHLMLDLWPVVVWSNTEPYTFTDVPPGDHVLMVELVNNDHGSLAPPVVKQLRFRTLSSQLLARTGEPRLGGSPIWLVSILAAGSMLVVGGAVLRWRAA